MRRNEFPCDRFALLARTCGILLLSRLFLPHHAFADLMVTLENPAPQQQVSGISVISGWAFSTVPQAQMMLQLYVDGEARDRIPCCVEREDVAQQFQGTPQARRSGFGLVFNFNRLSEGTHTIAVEVSDSAGSAPQSRTHTVTVVRPGGFETLSSLRFSSDDDPEFGEDHQEILVKEAEATDKETVRTQKVNLSLAWQQNLQALTVVRSENVEEPTGGYEDEDGDGFTPFNDCDDGDPDINPNAQEICDDDIDNDCDGRVDEDDRACGDSGNERQAIRMELENPADIAVGGIGLVSGWIFTTTPNAVISSLRLRVDGNLIGDIPCCSERTDVRDAFPDDTDTLSTGFGALMNFNRLDGDSHTFTVEAQNSAGETQKVERQVRTVKVGESEFLDQFDLSTATVSVVGDASLLIEDVKIRDKASQQTAQVTVSYQWEESCQCFVPQTGCGNGTIEDGEECDGASLDGESCASLGSISGNLSCRPRCDEDDDDCDLPCIFEVSDCRGGQFVYVTNAVSNTVSVIDTATDKVVATIKVGREPRGIAISSDGSVAYVTNFRDGTVSVLDTTTRTVVATLAVGEGPTGVAFAPDGTKAYVVNGFDHTVTVIDTATRKRDTTIRVGREPQAIAVARDGTSAYVTNFADNSVTVLDLRINRSAATIFVGRGPNGIAITPDDAKVYVVNYNDNTVSILDRAIGAVIDTVSVGLAPTKIAFAPDGEKAYVSNSVGNNISVIDTEEVKVEASLAGVSGDSPLGSPDGLVLPQGGARLYTALFGDGFGSTVQVTSTITGGVLRTIAVGEGPFAVAVTPSS